jgi:hypothetical protein
MPTVDHVSCNIYVSCNIFLDSAAISGAERRCCVKGAIAASRVLTEIFLGMLLASFLYITKMFCWRGWDLNPCFLDGNPT